MNIQEDIKKQIEIGFAKEEILDNLKKNNYTEEEITEAVRNTNWGGVIDKRGQSKAPKIRIIAGVLFALFAIARLIWHNGFSDIKNLLLAGTYLFGIFFIITLFIKKR